jgi:hypothetical protein
MAIRDATVKYFDSSQSGAPALRGDRNGDLVAVLDACLVNGYGSFAVTSLVVIAGVATLTAAGGHGLTNRGAPGGADVGVVVLVGGASAPQAALNREWRATVTDANVLTWECGTGVPDGTVAGVLTCGRAPGGYAKPFSKANVGVYRSLNPSNTGHFLRVEDAGQRATELGRTAMIRGYEDMTDVDTGTAAVPTPVQESDGIRVVKASLIDTTPRGWVVLCDSDFVWLILAPHTATPEVSTLTAWGDLADPVKSGDSYHWAILGGRASNTLLSGWTYVTDGWKYNGSAAHYISRGYLQVGGSIPAVAGSSGILLKTLGTKFGLGATAWYPYPMPVDNGLWLGRAVYAEDTDKLPRGALPGCWNPMHNAPFVGGTIRKNVPGMPDAVLLCVTGVDATTTWTATIDSYLMFDLVGPWR